MYRNASGQHTFRRTIGDVLDAAREPLKKLLEIKEVMGEYHFSAQYQQNPTPIGGSMVKAEWLRYCDPAHYPTFSGIYQSWDTANKSGELNSYSVCTTWGVYNQHYYVIDVYRERIDFPSLKRKVMELWKKYNPRKILIEDKASGTQLLQELRLDLGHYLHGVTPPPNMDKIMRLHAQTVPFENNKVILPTTAPWLEIYRNELLNFPGSKYYDQVDSTTQALDYLVKFGDNIWARLGRAR